MEEFRSFAFKSVSDELQGPAEEEECERRLPERVMPDGTQEQGQRQDDDAEFRRCGTLGSAMLVTACVSARSTLAGASTRTCGIAYNEIGLCPPR